MSESRPKLELVSVAGDPTPEEEAAAREAVAQLIEAERRATRMSVWRRASRGQGRRLGMYDYRDRFSNEDAWRLSARLLAGGREYPGRNGRGDTK
jgi:hypothetical protein